ncbi:hypothetical protein [Nonomuraea sp. NPDC049141]|uniref:hypothetical protein n=1 Tax=Nonomuraea sp. NPDC049141 TaxID=3155500 RepID=UPI0033C24ADB
MLSLLTGVSAAEPTPPPTTTPAKTTDSVPSADKDWDTPRAGSRLKVRDGCSAAAAKLFGEPEDGCTRPKAAATKAARMATSTFPAGCAAPPEGAWQYISRVEVCARSPLQAAKVYNPDRTRQLGQLNYFVTQYWHADTNADGRALGTWTYQVEVVAIPLGSWGRWTAPASRPRRSTARSAASSPPARGCSTTEATARRARHEGRRPCPR